MNRRRMIATGAAAALASAAVPIGLQASTQPIAEAVDFVAQLAGFTPWQKREFARQVRAKGMAQPAGILADLVDTWAARQEAGLS